MLKAVRPTRHRKTGGHFAIIASQYNARYVDSMLRAARKVLADAGAESVRVVRVPGAYEIPLVAAKLARAQPLSAVICLGVILRGETQHAQLIGEAVTSALMQLQIWMGVPMVHEVLLLENRQQAEARCLSPEHNRGAEAAATAVAMAQVLKTLR